MKATSAFLTIKQAAQQFNKSEQTIRRLVKQHVNTSHIRVEAAPKGDTYVISQAFLAQQYPSQVDLLPSVTVRVSVPEVAELQRQLVERDQTIQQLQQRLLEQNDMLNALTTQVNSQRIGRIEELLLSQNEQLGELQKRLSDPSAIPVVVPTSEPIKKGFWQRVFRK
jgi:AraC-like DNA-binding protein